MSGDIQNTRHLHSPWSVMNPPDLFAGDNGAATSSRPSPRKVELQGPRPTALKVNKDSYKIRKPPVHPPPNQQEGREKNGELESHQERKPVIIYAVSPKVIHTTVSDFMSVVQRLTGPDVATSSCAGGGGGGDVSPAARLASIERTIYSPPGVNKPNDQLSMMMMMNGDLRDGGGDGGACKNSGLLDDILRDYCYIPASDADGAGTAARGILSPAPGSMPPPISPGFFSSAAMDPFSMGGGGSLVGFSPSAAGICWSPAMASPSPTAASFDIFNPFFDF